jgi:hypothetical protein
MRLMQLRGTPSLVLIDKSGRIRHQHLGQVEDLRIGAEIGTLLAKTAKEEPTVKDGATDEAPRKGECDGGSCRIDA